MSFRLPCICNLKSISVLSGCLSIILSLNKCDLEFKIDMGADVTVIPEKLYKENRDGPLKRTTENLLKGASQQTLDIAGKFQGNLAYNCSEDKI